MREGLSVQQFDAGATMTKPPSEYDPEDSWNEDNGLEECAECGVLFCGNGGYVGETYTQDGTRYEHFYDTDPDDRPFFCASCWAEVDAERRKQENQSITDYA